MNPAGLVVGHVRKNVHPDFLTQAWCKFYEIACSEPNLVPRDRTDRNSALTVHLCEAPGAFVSALNHYMAIHHEGVRLEWLAMTLNPYHEGNGHEEAITDDRLIRNTLENWEFGPDYTGDIFQPGYSEHLYGKVRSAASGGACLVTADGSIDCSDDPGEQEAVVMRLHHYETMVALNVLRDGGSLVLKMFTMFECNTVCRMYLLCCVFRSVTVRKPATSKSGNSEVYVVCTGYRGRSFAWPYIRKFFATDEERQNTAAMFPSSQVPGHFTSMLLKCAGYFSRLQMATIEKNIAAWSTKDRCYRDAEVVRRALCREFLVRCGLRPIRRDQELVPGGCRTRAATCRGQNGGDTSHEEKTRFLHAPDSRQEADALRREVQTMREHLRRGRVRSNRQHDEDVTFYEGVCEDVTVRPSDLRFRLGKPVTVVRGSKFCSEYPTRCRVRATSTKFSTLSSERPASACDAEARKSHYRSILGRPRMRVCDLTDVCAANVADDATLQRVFTESVVGALRHLNAGDDLALVGYPLYTQTSVACFFAVASVFERHSLTTPDDRYGHALVFQNYVRRDDWSDALDEVRKRLEACKHNSRSALISWLPINTLLEQKAYDDIVYFNDLCMARETQIILNSFLNRAQVF